jgi:M6 family metalloprotease-like protein
VLLLALLLGTLPGPGSALAAPPYPGKLGTQGPREGLSTARLRPDFESMPGRGERIAAEAQGTWKTLAIRVSFLESPTDTLKADSSAAYYDRILLFLSQYWNQVTDGAVVVQPTLWDEVFVLPHPMAYYGDDARFQERLVYLVRDAIQAADPTVDFRPYQSIVIFHAGAGQETDVKDDSRDQIWSAFATQDDFRTVLPDTTGAVGIKTDDLIGGTTYYYVKEAVVLPERTSQDGYTFGMLGVTAHEFGHQLGLPDLYDTDGDVDGYNQGLGSWDIMAQGVWNANGFVPAGPSAWSRAFLAPTLFVPARVTDDATVSLAHLPRPIGGLPRAAIVPVTQSEYFLIENRVADLNGDSLFTFEDVNGDGCFDFYTDSYAGAEFDFFLPWNLAYGTGLPPGWTCDAGRYMSGQGVLIYHVDEARIAATLKGNTVNGATARKGVDLEEADGIEDLDESPSAFNSGSEADVFRRRYRDRFTPGTSPSSDAYGRVRTGISITEIGPPDPDLDADSIMTFQVSFDRNREGWPVALPARVRSTPPLAADLDGDGALELVVAAQRLNNTGAVYVLRPDGTDLVDRDLNPATREAFAAPAAAPVTTPCAGDIDGDGAADLVFAALNGSVYAFHADGSEVRDGDADPATAGVLVPGGGPGTVARIQPILVDLDGNGANEIVYGRSAGSGAGSTLTAVQVTATGIDIHAIPMGAAAGAAAAGDLDGDGLPEVIIANTNPAEIEVSTYSFSLANWEIFTDQGIPQDLESYLVVGGTSAFSPPVIADIDRDGRNEVLATSADGLVHAYAFTVDPHIPGDIPSGYFHATELPGFPVAEDPAATTATEVSLGDLEGDGHPEIFHTGGATRVTALHYNGAPRSGYPLRTAEPLAVQDSAGVWPPLIADADGDGRLDVLPVLPDGRRLAFRADGARIEGFGEVGSTAGPPPVLVDLDGDGACEWVEAFDQGTQALVSVRSTAAPIPPSRVAWGQYRNGPSRDGFFAPGPGSSDGTPILSEVYGYPNPSRTGSTAIHYRLGADASALRIRILDPAGATVAELSTGQTDLAGSAEHSVLWTHAGVASGPYLCRVEAVTGRGTEVRFAKLAVLR